MKEIIHTERAPEAIGTYSQALRVLASQILFCSGQIPIDPVSGKMVGMYRSHPATSAWPSAENIRLAHYPHMGGLKGIKAFHIREGKVKEESLFIEEGDSPGQ